MPRITFRLTQDEDTKFKTLLGGEGAGCENMGELLRLLLHREYNRRQGLAKPSATDWQTAHRVSPGPGKKELHETTKQSIESRQILADATGINGTITG